MTGAVSVSLLIPSEAGIEIWLNHFVGQFPWFDQFVHDWSSTNLTTSVVLVFVMWLTVFDAPRHGRLRDGHELIFGAAAFAMLATLTARAIAITMPFRPRPLATAVLHFRLPPGCSLSLIDWSAFPSDHATLFFALAIGILPLSRRFGWFSILWVTLASCLPLVYLGRHWPTDILAGAALGGCFVQLARIPSVRAFVRRNVELLYGKRPALFYALFFLWSYETAILFEDVRRIVFFAARHA